MLGQARYSGHLPAQTELKVIAELLQRWALAGYLPWSAGSAQLSVVLNQRRPPAMPPHAGSLHANPFAAYA